MRRFQAVGLLLLFCAALGAAKEAPFTFPRSAPETQGISSADLLGFVNEAEQKLNALHSFMLVRHGQVVAEGWWKPYAADEPHMLYSLSKSFTSTAVGLAVAEGKLKVDDPVLSFFPDEAPAEPSANLKAMRVRDLLTMSTGHHEDDVKDFPYQSDDSVVKAFLARPVSHKPGTFFFYNTPASYMLSAIVQKVTGQPVVEYLRPRLFDPLGIENPTWDASKQGVSLGGFGLNVRTEDIARFGQLYLQKGMWQGKQLLPAAWVETATSRMMSNGSSPSSDWEQGYGYQFWRSRHGFYRGDGAHGQFCLVLPQYDAVDCDHERHSRHGVGHEPGVGAPRAGVEGRTAAGRCGVPPEAHRQARDAHAPQSGRDRHVSDGPDRGREALCVRFEQAVDRIDRARALRKRHVGDHPKRRRGPASHRRPRRVDEGHVQRVRRSGSSGVKRCVDS